MQAMPSEFYGGINPVIKFKKVEKEIILNPPALSNKIKPTEKAMLDRATAAGAGQKFHPANLLASRKALIIGGVGLFIVFLGGAGVYYWQTSRPRTATPPRAPVAVAPPLQEAPIETPSATTTIETPLPEITPPAPVVPPSLSPATLEFPSKLLGDGVDLDSDGLTDASEQVFGSDPSLPDTDSDSYADGEEIFYLYDPAVMAPARLISGNSVVEFNNPFFSYQIYYPKNWALGNIDPEYRDVLFSAINGENIELKVFDMAAGESFEDWFTKMAPGEILGDLVDFESYFGIKGKARSDRLVYYFTNAGRVYVLVYHTLGAGPVEYRSVINTMARSFRLPGAAGGTAGTPMQ